MQPTLKAALFSVLSNTILVAFKLIIGLMLSSVSIMSEAIHSGIDLIASLIAAFSVKQSGKPADERHRYGHGKIENLSGTIEALLIFVAAIWIIVEAVKKFSSTQTHPDLGIGIAVMLLSGTANYFVSLYLFKVAKKHDSIALHADAVHLRADVYTSFGVAIGLILMQITGLPWLDPVMALLVAVLIINAAYNLTKEAVLPLLDENLPPEEEDEIIAIINSFSDHFLNFHKLRSRKAGSVRHIDLHLVVKRDQPVEAAHNFSHMIISAIKEKYPTAQILVHIEPCKDDYCDSCKICEPKRI